MWIPCFGLLLAASWGPRIRGQTLSSAALSFNYAAWSCQEAVQLDLSSGELARLTALETEAGAADPPALATTTTTTTTTTTALSLRSPDGGEHTFRLFLENRTQLVVLEAEARNLSEAVVFHGSKRAAVELPGAAYLLLVRQPAEQPVQHFSITCEAAAGSSKQRRRLPEVDKEFQRTTNATTPAGTNLQTLCKAEFGLDAKPAVPESDEENNAAFEACGINTWLGISDEQEEGVWRNVVTGDVIFVEPDEVVGYENWRRSSTSGNLLEPNGGPNENFVEFIGTGGGFWNDFLGDNALPVCCEIVQATPPPTTAPSLLPSDLPTTIPSVLPSGAPSESPTKLPTEVPTQQPSLEPSQVPTQPPSIQLSNVPSRLPSQLPSQLPTQLPSFLPTQVPTQQPSLEPSQTPSHEPSQTPSYEPSQEPSSSPSVGPSAEPTFFPSRAPSGAPSSAVSLLPTLLPSSQPSDPPSVNPVAPLLRLGNEVGDRVNAGAQISISADIGNAGVDSGVRASWILLEGSLAQDIDLEAASLTPTAYGYSAADFGTVENVPANLVLQSGALQPDVFYTLELRAEFVDVRSGVAMALVQFTVNGPPRGGSLGILPPGGNTLSRFSLAAEGWVDDPADLPLSFFFSVQRDPTGADVIELNPSNGSAEALTNVALPPGLEASGFVVLVFLTVRDALGAEVSIFEELVVETIPSEDLIATAEELLVDLNEDLEELPTDEGLRTINYITSLAASALEEDDSAENILDAQAIIAETADAFATFVGNQTTTEDVVRAESSTLAFISQVDARSNVQEVPGFSVNLTDSILRAADAILLRAGDASREGDVLLELVSAEDIVGALDSILLLEQLDGGQTAQEVAELIEALQDIRSLALLVGQERERIATGRIISSVARELVTNDEQTVVVELSESGNSTEPPPDPDLIATLTMSNDLLRALQSQAGEDEDSLRIGVIGLGRASYVDPEANLTSREVVTGVHRISARGGSASTSLSLVGGIFRISQNLFRPASEILDEQCALVSGVVNGTCTTEVECAFFDAATDSFVTFPECNGTLVTEETGPDRVVCECDFSDDRRRLQSSNETGADETVSIDFASLLSTAVENAGENVFADPTTASPVMWTVVVCIIAAVGGFGFIADKLDKEDAEQHRRWQSHGAQRAVTEWMHENGFPPDLQDKLLQGGLTSLKEIRLLENLSAFEFDKFTFQLGLTADERQELRNALNARSRGMRKLVTRRRKPSTLPAALFQRMGDPFPRRSPEEAPPTASKAMAPSWLTSGADGAVADAAGSEVSGPPEVSAPGWLKDDEEHSRAPEDDVESKVDSAVETFSSEAPSGRWAKGRSFDAFPSDERIPRWAVGKGFDFGSSDDDSVSKPDESFSSFSGPRSSSAGAMPTDLRRSNSDTQALSGEVALRELTLPAPAARRERQQKPGASKRSIALDQKLEDNYDAFYEELWFGLLLARPELLEDYEEPPLCDRLMAALKRHHDYYDALSLSPGDKPTRFIRVVRLFTALVAAMVISAVIYQALYPNDEGFCDQFDGDGNQEACEEDESQLNSDENRCFFEDGNCSPTQPDLSAQTIILIAAFALVFVVPLEAFVQFLVDEFLSQSPYADRDPIKTHHLGSKQLLRRRQRKQAKILADLEMTYLAKHPEVLATSTQFFLGISWLRGIALFFLRRRVKAAAFEAAEIETQLEPEHHALLTYTRAGEVDEAEFVEFIRLRKVRVMKIAIRDSLPFLKKRVFKRYTHLIGEDEPTDPRVRLAALGVLFLIILAGCAYLLGFGATVTDEVAEAWFLSFLLAEVSTFILLLPLRILITSVVLPQLIRQDVSIERAMIRMPHWSAAALFSRVRTDLVPGLSLILDERFAKLKATRDADEGDPATSDPEVGDPGRASGSARRRPSLFDRERRERERERRDSLTSTISVGELVTILRAEDERNIDVRRLSITLDGDSQSSNFRSFEVSAGSPTAAPPPPVAASFEAHRMLSIRSDASEMGAVERGQSEKLGADIRSVHALRIARGESTSPLRIQASRLDADGKSSETNEERKGADDVRRLRRPPRELLSPRDEADSDGTRSELSDASLPPAPGPQRRKSSIIDEPARDLGKKLRKRTLPMKCATRALLGTLALVVLLPEPVQDLFLEEGLPLGFAFFVLADLGLPISEDFLEVLVNCLLLLVSILLFLALVIIVQRSIVQKVAQLKREY